MEAEVDIAMGSYGPVGEALAALVGRAGHRWPRSSAATRYAVLFRHDFHVFGSVPSRERLPAFVSTLRVQLARKLNPRS